MLHRVLFWSGNPKEELYPLDGNFGNLDPKNWEHRVRNGGRSCSKRSYRVFDGRRFYEREDNGYWWSKGYGSMHRYIWVYYHGPIPAGYVVHHKDKDRSNNTLENLALMRLSEHSRIHAVDNTWTGSEENKSQLRKANLKRWADYRAGRRQEKRAGL